MMIDPVIHYSVAGAFALLFACSAAEKLRGPESFQALLADYELLPAALHPAAARLLPVIELTIATLLITPAYPVGAALGCGLLGLYGAAIAVNLGRGRTDIDCGCQRRSSNGISWFQVARNAVMLALLAMCLLPGGDRPLLWLDHLIIALTLVAVTLVYTATNLLITQYHDQRTWWPA